MVKIFTGKIGTDKGLDTTMASGTGLGAVLAPKKEMVYGYKRYSGYKPLSEKEYTDSYIQLLRERFRDNPAAFQRILQSEEATLLCYCKKGDFCHRRILAEYVLPKCAAHFGIEYEYLGER